MHVVALKLTLEMSKGRGGSLSIICRFVSALRGPPVQIGRSRPPLQESIELGSFGSSAKCGSSRSRGLAHSVLVTLITKRSN